MRRSTRSAKPKHFVQDADGSESSDEGGFDDDSDDVDNSGDDWQPEKKKKRKGKRGRGDLESETDEDEDDDEDFPVVDEEDEDELVMMARESSKPVKKKSKTIDVKRTSAIPSSRPNKVSNVVTDEDILAAQAAIEMDEEEEMQEQEAAEIEAAEMWDQVRKRKSAATASNQSKEVAVKASPQVEPTPASLSSWLGIPEPDWPTTCSDAMINDRDSLFVGFVYSLSSPSQSIISQLLSHLSKTVHPKAVPTNRLPPAMQHLASNRRGATHDMHAWRCLALKRGRSGLNGPEDFGLEEGLEDDGERFGAKPIEKVIKQLGATDVLVVVSRWYGGTMLGPARFQHIENCARAALSQYMINEALEPLKKQLQGLDDQLSSLRSQLGTSSSIVKPQYDELDLEKVERLIGARKKAIEMMQKRLSTLPNNRPPANENGKQGIREEEIPVSAPAITSQVAAVIPAGADKEQDGADLTGWDALE